MTVASRARTRMTMRANVERNQTATTNPYGHGDAPTWSALATIPCRVWTRTKRQVVDEEKTVIVEEIRAIFPLDADVASGDRLAKITDRQEAVLYAGPLSIDHIERRDDHVEALLGRDL